MTITSWAVAATNSVSSLGYDLDTASFAGPQNICGRPDRLFARNRRVARGEAAWPKARQRYLAGLPPRHSFFVTALLVDESDRREQVFIAVESIHDGRITGKIWNDVDIVRGYRLGDRYSFPESELRDWLITKPDGTEEGNFVGKFLESYEPPRICTTNTVGE